MAVGHIETRHHDPAGSKRRGRLAQRVRQHRIQVNPGGAKQFSPSTFFKVLAMSSKIKTLLATFSATLAIVLPAAVQAQYVGPSSLKVSQSVAEILKNPVDDRLVTLRGHLLRKIGKEKYLFSDGTGEIRVEIDDRDFPTQKINEKTLVEIRGEVEKDYLESPEIDAKRISVITAD
jgi:uncharacterized protein (TIGR00156 family)